MSVVTSQPKTTSGKGRLSPTPEDKNGEAVSARASGDVELDLYGLEELQKASYIHIEQQMPLDLKAGCGAGLTYHVKDKEGEKIFYGVEDDNCCCRWCCGPHRLFHITLLNNKDEPVLHLDRACCRCDCCCCLNCCLCQHSLVVRDKRGDVLGYAKQKFHIFNMKMDVLDHHCESFAKIRGPCCPCRCCAEINFDILNRHEDREEGCIFKRWKGDQKYVNMDHENYEMHYPEGSSIQQKAVLLGAAFLVGFMHFEMS